MKCKNCGNELKENDIFCSQCGKRVDDNKEPIIENDETSIDYSKANILTAISAILIFVIPWIISNLCMRYDGTDIANFLRSLDTIIPLAGIATLIYTRIKFPKHALSRVFLILLIILFIAILVYSITIMALCSATICGAMQNCPG